MSEATGDRPVGADADGPSLTRHLRDWLGTWPPELPLDVVGSEARTRPGRDGQVHRLVGVLDPDPPELGEPGLVLSVPPAAVEPIELLGGLDPEVLRSPPWCAAVTQALGAPDRAIHVGVFRWLDRLADVADLDDAGTWVTRDDRERDDGDDGREDDDRSHVVDLPESLVERAGDGSELGRVTLERHDAHGVELTVVIAPAARGRGLGRRLLATAARHVLGEGRVVTYRHDVEDLAAARVADAVGLAARGWRAVGLVPRR